MSSSKNKLFLQAKTALENIRGGMLRYTVNADPIVEVVPPEGSDLIVYELYSGIRWKTEIEHCDTQIEPCDNTIFSGVNYANDTIQLQFAGWRINMVGVLWQAICTLTVDEFKLETVGGTKCTCLLPDTNLYDTDQTIVTDSTAFKIGEFIGYNYTHFENAPTIIKKLLDGNGLLTTNTLYVLLYETYNCGTPEDLCKMVTLDPALFVHKQMPYHPTSHSVLVNTYIDAINAYIKRYASSIIQGGTNG